MLSDEITAEDLRIRIHHVGGSGSYGPVSALSVLEHVEWIVYDADETALAKSEPPDSGDFRLVARCIGGVNSLVNFNVLAAPSASSMLVSSPTAENYTKVRHDGTLRIWGRHTKIVKSVDVQVSTLDAIIGDGEAPKIDFLSIDAQGAELAIIDGASASIERTVGVLCEVEFAELYHGQPLFCDTQSRLRTHGFRLCEIYSNDYFNTAPLRPEIQGKGFLTVSEALFMKDLAVWASSAGGPVFETAEDVIQGLKLAAISVAFDQLDYALGICWHMEQKGLASLTRISDSTNVTYIKLLRDLCKVGRSIQDGLESSPSEPLASENQSRIGEHAKINSFIYRVRDLIPQVVQPVPRSIWRMLLSSAKWVGSILTALSKTSLKFRPIQYMSPRIIPLIIMTLAKRGFLKKTVLNMSQVSRVLQRYGLAEQAANHLLRSTVNGLVYRDKASKT